MAAAEFVHGLPKMAGLMTLRVEYNPKFPYLQENHMIRAISKTSQRGFTLVEVIVVAVIVAAMAAVAVPVYLNYIENSRENSAVNAAGATASFLASCLNGGGTIDAGIDGAAEIIGPDLAITCTGGVGGGATIRTPPNISVRNVGGNQIQGVWDLTGDDEAIGATLYTFR